MNWTVWAGGKSNTSSANLAVIDLQSLTVTDDNHSMNTQTVTDPNTPKIIYIEEDAKGFLDFDFQALFRPGIDGGLVHWKVEQGGQLYQQNTFANGNFISMNGKLKGANGNVTVTVTCLSKTLTINIVQPQVNITRIDTGMSDTWDAFKNKVENATPNNIIFYKGHCNPTGSYNHLQFSDGDRSQDLIANFLMRNKASVLFIDGCATGQMAQFLTKNTRIPVVIGTNVEITDAWATNIMAWLFEELKKSGRTVRQAIKAVQDKIDDPIDGWKPSEENGSTKPQLMPYGRGLDRTLQNIINNPQ